MTVNSKKKLIKRFGKIFARLSYKFNFETTNKSTFPLATDILRDNSKQELFRITLIEVEKIFCYLAHANETNFNSQIKNKEIIFSLVKNSLQEFLFSSYGYKINIDSTIIANSFYTKFLFQEENFLLSVPIQILLKENLVLFNSLFLPVYSQPSESFIEALLDNLIVEITNAVIFIIINEFSLIYEIRKNFYRSNFLSLRNVERFKNNLNWQIRIKKSINQPAEIYNSQQGIWVIRTTGIYYRVIYANRFNDLMEMKSFSLFTLFAIETRDFLICRVEEIFYFCGNTIRYILTSGIGQVIGLIWRGTIEGLKK